MAQDPPINIDGVADRTPSPVAPGQVTSPLRDVDSGRSSPADDEEVPRISVGILIYLFHAN
jgi:hypothetical protein